MIIDLIIGDPKPIYKYFKHPVTWMANMLMTGEKYLNNQTKTIIALRLKGFSLISFCCLIWFSTAYFIERSLSEFNYHDLLIALIASVFLAFRSLMDHINNVKTVLQQNDLDTSRIELAKIVGRDTESLDKCGITRASIETLAENFSDGVIAPAFWFLIGGLPGIVTYKMINTADSMVGNKSERYIHFGWASAKIDDLVNFIPARITAVIFILSSALTKCGSAKNGFKVAMRDSGLHASPNAGWPESTMAGILNVKLGGPRTYKNGSTKDAAWLGDGVEINGDDLNKAIKIAKYSWGLLLILLLCGTVI
ncbi:UNVERIFIED_CONTAM: hypothetical protein GTU68_022834 [Idotea baltica]|nr:hypothetical protein [Idotea baltica]